MIGIPGHKKSLVAIVRSAETATLIDAYCQASTDVVADIRVVHTAVADAPSIINGGADIVIIEAGHAREADLGALEQLCAYVARGGSFIVIMDEPTTDIVRRLFRAGVTDVLPTPVMENELIAALNTARGRAPAIKAPEAPRNGKIVVILKTAGGVGATTVTTNLASAMAALKVGEVAAIDLDVQFGQIATSLDIRSRMTVIDAIRAGVRLDSTLLASTYHDHESGVKVLSAPREITPLEAITDEFIERLFSCMRAVSTVSFVEVPAAWTQWVGLVVDKADLVVPVVEPSVRSAAGAARIGQSFLDFGLTRLNLYVLANKFEKTLENVDRVKKIADIFRAKPAGSVRIDEKAAIEAGDRGLLFATAAPKSLATKDFETNARNIATALGLQIATAPTTPPPAAAIDRLLGGRFGGKGRTQ